MFVTDLHLILGLLGGLVVGIVFCNLVLFGLLIDLLVNFFYLGRGLRAVALGLGYYVLVLVILCERCS